MKHKNPAPQTRVMGIIVWCHNIHFRRLTKHHWGYHLAHWGRSSAPQGGNLQGTGCHPPPCHPHTPPRLQLTPLPSPAHHVPAAAGENWLSPGPRTTVGPAAQCSSDPLSWRVGQAAATRVLVLRPGVSL